MTSYRDIKARIVKLEKQAADLFKKETADVVARIQALMAEYGLTVADLNAKAARKVKPASRPAGVAKYRDPVSGKTWSGYGKAPGWLADAVKRGKSKDDFLVGKKGPAAKGVAGKAARATPAVKAKAAKKPAAQKAAAQPAAKKAAVAAKAPVRKAARKTAVKVAPAAAAAPD
jgi:DNA-binding protein H-NS